MSEKNVNLHDPDDDLSSIFKNFNFFPASASSPFNANNINVSSEQSGISKNEMSKVSFEAFKDAFKIISNNSIQDFNPEQNFKHLKETCSNENLFIDTEFKACDDSIFLTETYRQFLTSYEKMNSYGEIVWKRAKDLVENAQFALDDKGKPCTSPDKLTQSNYKKYFYSNDLDQGALGNCWFISASIGIIQNFDLFKKVVPFDNSFEDSVYNGAFHFNFWKYGTWVSVVVDDYLPVGPEDKLIFSKNRKIKNEFWCALLEKAYAKMCGSYEALDGGLTSNGLVDFSGGIEESYDLSEISNPAMQLSSQTSQVSDQEIDQVNFKSPDFNSFWKLLMKAKSKHSVIGCNLASASHIEEYESSVMNTEITDHGLVKGHAYVITKLVDLTYDGKNYRLIRLKNPWGEGEWQGDWSDKSTTWKRLNSKVKEKIGLNDEDDGEFWMSYEDWLMNFDYCQICNLTPDSISSVTEKDWQDQRQLSNIFSLWQCQTFHGKWIKDISAGGSGQVDEEKYWTNPQFKFYINSQDASDGEIFVIIGLMQKLANPDKLNPEVSENYIHFRLYRLEISESFNKLELDNDTIDESQLELVGMNGAYKAKREVSKRFSLPCGVYVIVPSCYHEDVESEFLVRIFTEKPLSNKTTNSSPMKSTVKKSTKKDENNQTLKQLVTVNKTYSDHDKLKSKKTCKTM